MRKIITAVGFLTIIPFWKLFKNTDDKKIANNIGESSSFFTLTGLFIGVVLIAVSMLLEYSLLNSLVKATLLLLILTIFTGGLHIDGLADTIDGMVSGWDRERALQIMKHGSIGPFGSTAIFFVMFFKVLLIEVAAAQYLLYLLVFPVMGRWAMVYSMFVGKPAKDEGLGKVFIEKCGIRQFLVSTAVMLAVLIPVLREGALTVIFVTIAIVSLLDLLYRRKFGGITGDTLGANCEISEVIALLVIAQLL